MANRFWVGGTANWDALNILNWSATSGGIGGASVPTSADAVLFNANSGANTITLADGYNPSIFSLTMTGFTGTLNFGSQNISVGGTSTVYSGGSTFSVTGTPVINCTNSTATGKAIISVGTTEANAISFNITAGTGSFVISNTSVVKNLNFTGFSGTLGNNNFIVFGNLTLSSDMTVAAGANAITFAATSGTQQFTTSDIVIDKPITQNGVGGTLQLQDALTMGSTRALTITNGKIQLNNSVTSTVGSFVTSGTNQKFLESTTPGLQATLSQASGTVNASYLTIKDINATGGATWNARTDLGSKDIANNTGWNFIFIGLQQILKPIMAKILQPIILN
jgi:hypothetical protein